MKVSTQGTSLIVELTEQEKCFASAVATARSDNAQRKGLKDPLRHDPLVPEVRNNLGTRSELAVACLTGQVWFAFDANFIDTPKEQRPLDVGPIEVKCGSQPDHNLIIKWNDDPNNPFVLALPEEDGRLRLVGWSMGTDCERADWLPDPGWWRSSESLEPLESLRDWCSTQGWPWQPGRIFYIWWN
jgi:hypothetical protein